MVSSATEGTVNTALKTQMVKAAAIRLIIISSFCFDTFGGIWGEYQYRAI
jgi:hypothetical protein